MICKKSISLYLGIGFLQALKDIKIATDICILLFTSVIGAR